MPEFNQVNNSINQTVDSGKKENQEQIHIKNVLYVDDVLGKVNDKEKFENDLKDDFAKKKEESSDNLSIHLVEKIDENIIRRAEECDMSILDVEMMNENMEVQNAIRKSIEDIISDKEKFKEVFEKIKNTEKQLENLGIEFTEKKEKSGEPYKYIWIQKTIQCFPREDKDYHGDISSYFNNEDFRYGRKSQGQGVLWFMKAYGISAKLSGLGIAKILKEKNKEYILYTTGIQAHDPQWITFALALDVISPEEIIGVVKKMLEDENTKLINKYEEDNNDANKGRFVITAPEEKVYREGKLAVINTSNDELKVQGVRQLLQKLG